MLTVSSIGSAAGASNYYGKDDYYVSGEADAPGAVWGGQGAEKVGLKGKVDQAEFRTVLEGKHEMFKDPARPEAQTKGEHRAGWDLTFSAPKSASIMAVVYGSKPVVAAHDKGVAAAMAYAEKHFAMTRVRDQGKIKEVYTGNLIYAKVNHTLSRAGDPDLHTHVVTANATVDPTSGKVRALESLPLFRGRMVMGLIYQAELGKNLMQHGWNVTKDQVKGTVELAGFTRNQIMQFSKRHEQIQDQIKEIKEKQGGVISAVQRDQVALKDRPKKLNHDRSELAEKWKAEAKSVGLDGVSLQKEARERAGGKDVSAIVSGQASALAARFVSMMRELTGNTPQPQDPYGYSQKGRTNDPLARTAVSYGVRLEEQGRAVFSRHDVVKQALLSSPAGVTVDRITGELDKLVLSGKVQDADKTIHAGVTTSQALHIERGIIERVQDGKGRAAPVLSAVQAHAALTASTVRLGGFSLNEGQMAAGVLVLSSSDRYVAVQGFAGVGKTTMFKAVNDVAIESGRQMVGVAPTHAAADALNREAGIPAKTMEKFLSQIEAAKEAGGDTLAGVRQDLSGKILLADESSMLSNAQMDRLVKAADVAGIDKIVTVGDERQLASPEAGAPFRHMLESGVETGRMTQIRRQKDENLLTSVQALAEGKAHEGLRALGERVVAVGRQATDVDLAQAAFAAWREKSADGREVPVVVPTHSLRSKVSDLVRVELSERGQLIGQGEDRQTLRQVRMTDAEAFRAASYKEGQQLVFHARLKDADIRRGETVEVVGRDFKNDRLMVQHKDKTVAVDLAQLRVHGNRKFEAFEKQTIEVRQGERLVWETRNPDKGIQKGEAFTVTEMGRDTWTVKLGNGDERQMRASAPELRFISHAYAETADRAQGSTYRDVVAVLSSNHSEGANLARAYVQVSRAAESLTFVTNDQKTLAMKLSNQSGMNKIACQELRDTITEMPVADKDQLVNLGDKDIQDAKVPNQVKGFGDGDQTPAKDGELETGLAGPGKAANEPDVASGKEKDLDKGVAITTPAMEL